MPKQSFSFDLSSPTVHSEAVRQALEQLLSLLDRTDQRAELEWEIRVYRWILHQADPEPKAKAWFAARHLCGHDKRARCATLGWEIP